jgi:hypothetical protein
MSTTPVWVVGEWAFCTVHGAEGWYKVVAIRPRDKYIKISGQNPWCPPHNFARTDRQGKSYE